MSQGPSLFSQTGFGWGEDLCDYSTNYKLVFEDDFTGEEVDYEKWATWQPFAPDGSDQCESCRVHGEVIYRPGGVLVHDGIVTIKARRQTSSWFGVTKEWMSGILFSRQPYVFNEGKFEIRCQIPSWSGSIPAFWLFGEGNNEIDVFEFCGMSYQEMKCSIHRHDDGPGGQHDSYNKHIESQYLGWHTYAVEWLDDWVIWYFDGEEVHRRSKWWEVASNDDCTLSGPYSRGIFPTDDARLNVLVSMGMSDGGFCGPASNALPGATFDFNIDYVRVWQNEGHFEQGLSNLCLTDPGRITGQSAICTNGEEVDYELVGVHGDPVVWHCYGAEILESNNDHLRIRTGIAHEGFTLGVVAEDASNACAGSTSILKRVRNGPPEIESAHVNTADRCEDFFCIEYPEVYGGMNNVRYDYSLFIDDVRQDQTFLPYVPQEVPGGQNVYGMDCLNYLVWCPIYTTWPYENEPFCYYTGQSDFCHEIKIVAENECGTVSETWKVRDNCKFGLCDLEDAESNTTVIIADMLSIYPVPAGESFTITLDPSVDIKVVSKVEIRDALMNLKFSKNDPMNQSIQVQCSSWGPGVYYAYVFIKNESVVAKIQIK